MYNMKKQSRKLITILLSIFLTFGISSGALAALYPYLGGTGSSVSPAGGQILIGTDGSVYAPAYLIAGDDISIANASGSVTISLEEDLTITYGISAATATITNITGALTGNADTATALAANGANCNAGEYALGVNASGAVESCTDATTEINTVVNALGGTNLTCASETCNVDDSFLLNTGDSGTGNYTLGDLTVTYGINPATGTFDGLLTADGDLTFNDEIKPDGSLCLNNQILKKTGADDWDCVHEETDSAIDYFINNTASGFTDTYTMKTSETGDAEASIASSTLGTGDDQFLFGFLSDIAVPFHTIQAGTYHLHAQFEKTDGTKSTAIYWTLTASSTDGTQTLLLTSEALTVTDTKTQLYTHAATSTSYTFTTGDKILLNIYANVGSSGSAAEITIYMEGNDDAHLTILTPTSAILDLSVLVDGTNPLTANWNVGGFNITEIGTASTTALTVIGNATLTNTTSTQFYSTQIGINSEYFTDITGEGIQNTSKVLTFDCSDVEGTGINCSGEDITLDATGDWTGTFDGVNGSGYLLSTYDTGLGLTVTYSTTTNATTTNLVVTGTLALPNDSILDAMIDWGNLTDLDAGGEVTWSNLASGELTSEVLLIGTDVKAGTLTDTKLCLWDDGNSQIVCDTSAGAGDVESVGDCSSGACFDGTSDGGTYLDFYDAQGFTRLIGGDNSSSITLTLPTATGTVLTQEAIDTSAELAAIVGDETGTGSLVFANNPTMLDITLTYGIAGATSTWSGLITASGGVTGTGAWNLGGAVVEITNSASVQVSTAGHIGIDTTSGQVRYSDGTATRTLSHIKHFSFDLEDPVDADEITLWKVPYNITLTQIDCLVDPAVAGTAIDIDIFEADANGDSTTTAFDIPLTCGNTNSATTTFANATIDANDWIGIYASNASGTVSWLSLTGRYTIDPD